MKHPIASFKAGPLLYLTSLTKTEDHHWLKKGTDPKAPFPAKSYFVPIVDKMLTEEALFIPKSREMMTSWLACGFINWMCKVNKNILWLIQTEKEEKVKRLINYCRILSRNEPEWLRERNPIVGDNQTSLTWKSGSEVLGVPKGENQVRMHHPHGYLMDEAAFLPEAEQCFNAVRPVCKQIFAVSSDGIGWFHNVTQLHAN